MARRAMDQECMGRRRARLGVRLPWMCKNFLVPLSVFLFDFLVPDFLVSDFPVPEFLVSDFPVSDFFLLVPVYYLLF